MTIHQVIKPGFLLSTQGRREDKSHNEQDNRRVQAVKVPNPKSVCGRVFEIEPRSHPGQHSAFNCSSGSSGLRRNRVSPGDKDLGSVPRSLRSMGQSLRGQLPF